jgi:hypothetical protein
MQGSHPEYPPPRVVDHGTLVDMTATLHPLFGAAAPHDLSFSAAVGGPGLPGGGGEVVPTHSGFAGDPGSFTGAPTHGVDAVVPGTTGGSGGGVGSGVPGGGNGGASGGASGGLPFTGFAAGAAAALGGAFVAVGASLRHVLRRSRH